MAYTLFNKRLNRKLTHPKVGLWFTTDIKEAEDMLKSCKEYIRAIGVDQIINDFEIIEINENDI